MTMKSRAFRAHVKYLERVALTCADKDRRLDAVRSLATIVIAARGI